MRGELANRVVKAVCRPNLATPGPQTAAAKK
jgi:hypothetical protein